MVNTHRARRSAIPSGGCSVEILRLLTCQMPLSPVDCFHCFQMDKYTVDLDKVLNDFEYSELTDNYTAGKSYHTQTSSNYASSSKSKSGDAKHSITKVFHSLNEYLNTDISSSNIAKVQLDNNKENHVASTNNNSFIQPVKSKSVVYVDNSIDSVDIDNKLKELELNVSEVEGKTNFDCDTQSNEQLNTVDTLLDLNSEENHVSDNKGFIHQINSDNIQSLLDLDGIDLNSASFNERINDYPPICLNNVFIANPTEINTIKPVESERKVPGEPDLKDNKVLDDNIKEISKTEIDKYEIGCDITIDSAETVSNVNEREKILKPVENNEIEVEEIVIEEAQEVEVAPEAPAKDVISFNNALDIDDSTLNEYLDILEDEFHEICDGEPEDVAEIEDITNEAENIESEIPEEEVLCVTKENTTADGIQEDLSEFKAAVIQDKNVEQDTESVTSIERPKMLEIPENEVPKREINLIGKSFEKKSTLFKFYT